MEFVLRYSFGEYLKRGITLEVFCDTFKFITRFVSETKDDSGKYSSSHGTFQQGTKRMKF